MPAVLCGLNCFDVPVSTTASGIAREFSASLNPALNSAGCPVEVFRLERLAPDAQIAVDDIVVCTIPGWQFDFAALEELHREFEELRYEHDNLQVQYSRMKEVTISLNASIEASEAQAAEASAPVLGATTQRRGAGGDCSRGNRREVDQLKLQLSQSEKKQQETKATVMALRNEFMQLVDMMTSAGGPKCQGAFELASVMNVLEKENVKNIAMQSPHQSPELERPAVVSGGGSRHYSQPPSAPGARRPMGSPRVYRTPVSSTYSTPRPGSGARPRTVHQRSGHSAGASIRHQRQMVDL